MQIYVEYLSYSKECIFIAYSFIYFSIYLFIDLRSNECRHKKNYWSEAFQKLSPPIIVNIRSLFQTMYSDGIYYEIYNLASLNHNYTGTESPVP